jgi:hypothetical protein
MATLKQLQDSREALQQEVASLNEEEATLIKAVTAERIAAAERGPPSDSEVGNSQHEEEQRLIDIHTRIMQCYTDIEKISNDINRSLGVKGGRRRKTLRHRRRKHRKTLRRK